jgi:hypothetical protein
MRNDVDELIDSRRYVTPLGGEVVVESSETYDSPCRDAAKEELPGILDAVLYSAAMRRSGNGERNRMRDALIESLEDDEYEEKDLDSLIEQVTSSF